MKKSGSRRVHGQKKSAGNRGGEAAAAGARPVQRLDENMNRATFYAAESSKGTLQLSPNTAITVALVFISAIILLHVMARFQPK